MPSVAAAAFRLAVSTATKSHETSVQAPEFRFTAESCESARNLLAETSRAATSSCSSEANQAVSCDVGCARTVSHSSVFQVRRQTLVSLFTFPLSGWTQFARGQANVKILNGRA